MEKEFEIKIKSATTNSVNAIFRTEKSDLELLLPLRDGKFDFSEVEKASNYRTNPVREGEQLEREMAVDSNLFIESVSQVIHGRFYKEIELHGEPRTDIAELMEIVQNDIKKGFDDKLKEMGVNHDVDDIEVKFTDGSTIFNDYSGGDLHQFCFEVSHLNRLSKFEIFVNEVNPKVNREGLQLDYGNIFGGKERFNYVMDQMDVVIEQQMKEEQEMDFAPLFDRDESVPELKAKKSRKRDRGNGFSM